MAANSEGCTEFNALFIVPVRKKGFIRYLVTQNIDGLHQKAGSKLTLDLHGRLGLVTCLGCDHKFPRSHLQDILIECNPEFDCISTASAPDGDALLDDMDVSCFRVPVCPVCRGILKPDVVFFGEQVPKMRVNKVIHELDKAQALLIIGSSLMVFSGYRFCKYARAQGKLIALLNQGRTRADNEINLKIELPCSAVLPEIARKLSS